MKKALKEKAEEIKEENRPIEDLGNQEENRQKKEMVTKGQVIKDLLKKVERIKDLVVSRLEIIKKDDKSLQEIIEISEEIKITIGIKAEDLKLTTKDLRHSVSIF